MSLVLALLLQIGGPPPDFPIGLPDPDAEIIVGGEIEGPFIFWEDSGQTTKVVLKNGLTVILRESNADTLTSITTHVKVGYFDEPDPLSGITHLIQNMMFRDSEESVPGGFIAEIRALGGASSAYTAYDRTVYETVVPADNAVAAMELHADAFWYPVFDPNQLALEAEVMVAESLGIRDNPDLVARERLYRTAFGEHRIRRSLAGSADGLRGLTLDDLTLFHGRYYQPSNVILALVGQFNRRAMLEEVARIYGDVDDTEVDRDAGPAEPPQSGLRYNWERGPIEQPRIAIGYHVPGVDVDGTDPYTLEVFSAILTGGRASRMNWFLRDEQGLISVAESSYMGLPGLGYFMLRLEASDPGIALIAAFGELDRIRRFGVTEEEVARARLWVARHRYNRLETVEGIADLLAVEEARGDWNTMEFYLEGIRGVTPNDISTVVERYFSRDNLSVFEYLPRSSTRSLSSADFESSVLNQVPVNIVERSIQANAVSAEVDLLDYDLVVEVIPPLQRHSILRGPDVYIAEDHRLPLVSFGIFFPGGRLAESEENAGITELMLGSALRGTRQYNTADIARRIENAGAQVEIVNEPDFYGYVLNGVSSHMADAIDVLMEVLQEPTFLEDEVELEKALQTSSIRRLRDDRFDYPIGQFMATLFDDHAYARPAAGTEESLGSLTSDSLVEWHQQHQRTVMPLIVIVGDTKGTGLISPITETLTNDDLFPRNVLDLPFPVASLNAEESLIEADRQQSVLVYGTTVAPYSHEDRLPLTVIRHVLSGPGGRLSSSLREEQGMTYEFEVKNDALARAGAFLTYAAFSPENEQAVRDTVRLEMERLIDEGITEEELAGAVNYAIGLHEMEQETLGGRLLELARAILSGADVSAVQLYAEDLRQVDRFLVQFVAERYLSAGQAKTVVIRGER